MKYLPSVALASIAAFMLFGQPAAPAPTPWQGCSFEAFASPPRSPLSWSFDAYVGGPKSPDGEEVAVDLPGSLQKANIASKGLGCCVFRSLDHAARWQGVESLWAFPEWMVSKRIEGGGYPSKVDKLIPQIAKDRGMEVPRYVQFEGRDLDLIKLALRTGRMPSVTYGRSPTGRYGGRHIDHMVNLVHLSDKSAVVLDNNYPGPTQYEWMTPAEFLRAYTDGSGQGWTVVLLDNPPPPPPRNR